MNKEQALNVKIGDTLILVDCSQTPGRAWGLPYDGEQNFTVEKIIIDKGGNPHFAQSNVRVPTEDPPLKSRDTGEEIDGSRTYWLHPSRFEFSKTEGKSFNADFSKSDFE